MEKYKNLGGDSNVAEYEIGPDFIKVKFKGTPLIYVYTHGIPGRECVERMKLLAKEGHGLNSYITRFIKKRYERKERIPITPYPSSVPTESSN